MPGATWRSYPETYKVSHYNEQSSPVIGRRPSFRSTFHQLNSAAVVVVNNNNIIHVKLSTSIGVGCPCVAKLNVPCINVRSVKNKDISFRPCNIDLRDIDIFALTETWLGSSIDGHVISN